MNQTGALKRASHDRPLDSLWERHDPWDLAASAQRLGTPGTTTSENLAECETLKRMFHDTANRCHHNGLRFTPVVFD